jgi:hypothetical protein
MARPQCDTPLVPFSCVLLVILQLCRQHVQILSHQQLPITFVPFSCVLLVISQLSRPHVQFLSHQQLPITFVPFSCVLLVISELSRPHVQILSHQQLPITFVPFSCLLLVISELSRPHVELRELCESRIRWHLFFESFLHVKCSYHSWHQLPTDFQHLSNGMYFFMQQEMPLF